MLSFIAVLSLAAVVSADIAKKGEGPSKYAYVSLLCSPVEREQHVRMLLTLTESIREFDEENDVIAMVHGNINEEQWHVLDQENIEVVNVEDVGKLVSDPEPLRVPAEVSECNRAKLNALKFTQYEKVIFIDSDSMVKEDLRFMFENDGFMAYEGYESPLNAGLFAVKPSTESLKDIKDIFESDDFHPANGWMNVGTFPHWRLAGHVSDWSFWGAHSDQGILYYYYDKVVKNAVILSMRDGAKVVTHFTGWNKPVLHKSQKLGDVEFRESHAEWYRLWDRVQERTGVKSESTTVKKESGPKEAFKSSDAVSKASTKLQDVVSKKAFASRVKRVLDEDPYCEAPATMGLFDTSTQTDIGPIVDGDVIDLAAVGCDLSIVAFPDCKESMKMKLLDSSGSKVAAQKEVGGGPFSLGKDIDATGEVLSVPELAVAGTYEMSLNPVPGGKTFISFTIVGACS